MRITVFGSGIGASCVSLLPSLTTLKVGASCAQGCCSCDKHLANTNPGKGAHPGTTGHPSKVRAAFWLVAGESLTQCWQAEPFHHGQGEASSRARGSQGWSWCSQCVGLQPRASTWVWEEVGTLGRHPTQVPRLTHLQVWRGHRASCRAPEAWISVLGIEGKPDLSLGRDGRSHLVRLGELKCCDEQNTGESDMVGIC